ncbi:MAG: hypothetical protein IJT05_07365 [Lachnospiraceae bacterium]|nr:hypothetical protein [Lachnospiraceae bacterium]
MFDFMFRRTKELEKKLAEKEEQLEECRAVLREVNSLQEHEKNYFLKVTEERTDLAKGLARVATESRKGKDFSVEAAERTEKLSLTFSELSEDLRGFLEEAGKNTDTSFFDREKSEAESDAGRMQENTKKLLQTFADTKLLREELKEYFRKMNVLALSAAIEGQKAGDRASKFVSAAEEIRTKSDETGKSLIRLINLLETGEKLAQDVKERNERIEKRRRDAVLRAEKEAAAPKPDVEKQKGRMEEIKKELILIREGEDKAVESAGVALSEMDALGTRFLEEQKSAEEAEYYFRQVLGEEMEGLK